LTDHERNSLDLRDSLSYDATLSNSVVPFPHSIQNENNENNAQTGDSMEEVGSPVAASAAFALPVFAVIAESSNNNNNSVLSQIIERDQPEKTGCIPNAAPVAAPIHHHFIPSILRVPLNPSELKAFLLNPIPIEYGRVNCYIRRNRSGDNRSHPMYTMYSEDGNRFLMTANKKSKNFIVTSRKNIFIFSFEIFFPANDFFFFSRFRSNRSLKEF
jgi:hypothetical protein